jgi:hypothetical protein
VRSRLWLFRGGFSAHKRIRVSDTRGAFGAEGALLGRRKNVNQRCIKLLRAFSVSALPFALLRLLGLLQALVVPRRFQRT